MPTPPKHELPSLGEKVRYQVDRFLSWSPVARFIGLFGLSTVLVALCAALVLLTMPRSSEAPFDYLEALWWALTRVLDAGTMGGDQGTLVRAVAILSTLCGVGVVALLIGFVSSTVSEKLEDLRRGKSPVIDVGHTLILGFGEKVFPILRELREANANQKQASVVLLSTHDKQEVETAIAERMGDMGTTRVVVRQGSPASPHDLRKVGAGRARSIIVLAGESGADEHPDMAAIKALLALRRVPGALKTNHAVVELIDSGRRSVVERLGAGGVEVVAMEETLSRLMAQTVRQNGLAQVYRSLLTYEGSEFYFRSFPDLAGQPFGATQWKMKGAVVVGVRRVHSDGRVDCVLNPTDDLVLAANDQLLVIAEDDDAFSLTAQHAPTVPADFAGASPRPRSAEKLLLCGMSAKLGDVLRELDRYVQPGSEAWLMPGRPKDVFAEFLKREVASLKNLRLKYVDGDPTLPEALGRAVSEEFAAALVMSDTSVDPEQADAKTVITVLLLREAMQGLSRQPRLISEILDPRTKDLLETEYGADFVVSSELTSMLLAQVSEHRALNAVFADLFDSDGNELYLKRAACYAPLGEPTSWLVAQKVARARGEVAIGYQKHGEEPTINPPQDSSITFVEGDRVVVVAEDDSEEPRQAREFDDEPTGAETTLVSLPSSESVVAPEPTTSPGLPAAGTSPGTPPRVVPSKATVATPGATTSPLRPPPEPPPSQAPRGPLPSRSPAPPAKASAAAAPTPLDAAKTSPGAPGPRPGKKDEA